MSDPDETGQPEEEPQSEVDFSALDTVQSIWNGVAQELEQHHAQISPEAEEFICEEPKSPAQHGPMAARMRNLNEADDDFLDADDLDDFDMNGATSIDPDDGENPTNMPTIALHGQNSLPHDSTEEVPHIPKPFT